jgi:hypothetical protein
MFHQTQIACCSGGNKQESKKRAAKLAIKKVAPNLYEDLFGDEDEELPAEYTKEVENTAAAIEATVQQKSKKAKGKPQVNQAPLQRMEHSSPVQKVPADKLTLGC